MKTDIVDELLHWRDDDDARVGGDYLEALTARAAEEIEELRAKASVLEASRNCWKKAYYKAYSLALARAPVVVT